MFLVIVLGAYGAGVINFAPPENVVIGFIITVGLDFLWIFWRVDKTYDFKID
jgi:hypothetical protein